MPRDPKHEWMFDPLYPPTDPVWATKNADVMATITKCENCGGYVLSYDNKWWEMVSWDVFQSKWRTHTPARCSERRANGQKKETT
jgi:hypothetical protein